MDPHEQFFSEEFVQYAAECRRMARLARTPAPTTSKISRSMNWFARLRRQFDVQHDYWSWQRRLAVSPVRRPI
jgi:hypothetical protein